MAPTVAGSEKSTKAAFVGFGEAASAFVKGWSMVFEAMDLVGYDIKSDSPDADVRAAKATDYKEYGVHGCAKLADALRGNTTVFSLVTADQAFKAAQAAAGVIEQKAFFLDCNSCAPETKRASAEVIEAAGGRYVDVAVMAPVHPGLHRVPLLISGPHAEEALAVFEALDMQAEVSSDTVGASSSIKMIRSVMIKGLEALVVECVLAGRKAGVDDVVLATLEKTFPGFDWPKRAAYMMERVASHGVRRAAEMREVSLTIEQLDLFGDMSRATTDWQQRIGDLDVHLNDNDYGASADALLSALEAKRGAL